MAPVPDILGIDLGASWAYCYGPRDMSHGFNVIPNDIGNGRAYCMFRDGIVRLINKRKPDFIAVEQPFINYRKQQPQQVRRWHSYCAMLEMLAYTFGLPLKEYAPSTIKLHFVGHGFAEKFLIGMECERRGWFPQNADVADAMATMSCAAGLPRSAELQLIIKGAK